MEKLLQEIKAAFESFQKAQMQVNEDLRKLATATQEGGASSIKALTEKADASAEKVQKLADQLVALEQKLVKGVQAGAAPAHSLGILVSMSDQFKAFASGNSDRMRMDVKQGWRPQANTISGQSGSPAANNDTLSQADRLSGIVPGAFRNLRVRDVLPQGTTTSNLVEFTRELSFTNDAAETAEGATKPESDMTFELVSAPVVTIAHWIKVSRQVLNDAPALASYIDNRLRYGVEYRTDSQLINGTGTGQNLKGLTHADNSDVFTPTSGENALDSINRAKYQLIAADYAPTAVFLNPADWGNIERTKVSGSDDRYVIGDPRSPIGPSLWGMPVVVTNALTSGKLLIGAFDIACQVMQREGVVVEISNSNDTDFVKNLLTVRAEERLTLCGFRPASVLYGNLTV